MTTDNKIRGERFQYNINRDDTKISTLSYPGKLIIINILEMKK